MMNFFLAILVLPPLAVGFATGLVFAPFRFGFVAALDQFERWSEAVSRRRFERRGRRP